MKIKVKAITSVMHGRHHMQAGDELEVTKGEADELQKAGLVQIVGEQEAAAQPGTPDTKVAAEDLTGVEKMEDEPQNKMEPAPENKAGGKKSTAKKAD